MFVESHSLALIVERPGCIVDLEAETKQNRQKKKKKRPILDQVI